MPPGPAFNVLCVVSAFTNVLSHAARIRATQIARQNTSVTLVRTAKDDGYPPQGIQRHTPNIHEERNIPKLSEDDIEITTKSGSEAELKPPLETGNLRLDDIHTRQLNALHFEPSDDALNTLSPAKGEPAPREGPQKPPSPALQDLKYQKMDDNSLSNTPIQQESTSHDNLLLSEPEVVAPTRTLRASRVPSSRIGRLFHYGGLAASLGYGAASEMIQRSTGLSSQSSSPVMMTEANVHRLVSKLLKMRGAALKLGQFMSIQDTHVLPPAVDKIFRMVQDSAHYMPDWQMEQVLSSSLGEDWMSYFDSLDRIPFAAASIGQVHKAVLSASHSPTGQPEEVAVKVQFPNIVDSIESDIGYIKLLLTAGSLLPKGLFLDRTIHVMKEELRDECDYTREASFLRRFGSPEFLGNDPRFKVPWVWDGSTSQVLVMERVYGVNIGEITHQNVVDRLSRSERNDIASSILQLCLRELFDFRLMQTDPNWTNFLWNAKTRQIELVDFGATREYTKEFMDNWLHLLQSAISEDRNACIEWSIKLGYLTGEENDMMLDSHVRSMTLLAAPFRPSTAQPFAFGPGSAWTEITANIRAEIPVMLQHRLTPPPRETYSLNRKLSGSFLLAARLGAQFDTRALWEDVVKNYQFTPPIQ